MVYRGAGRSLVLGLKHGDRTDIVPQAAQWMFAAGRDLLADAPLVVPVPLHPLRLLRRRYNQAALLARAVARLSHAPYAPGLLIRTRRTPQLGDATREERFSELSNAIRPHPRHGSKLRGQAVVLIDDVMTTGATLSAASDACRTAGAREIRTITLARAVHAP